MLRDAIPADMPRLAALLAEAFRDNPSVNFIAKQDARRHRRIRALMDYSLALCSRFGRVLVNEDGSACALLLFPQQKRAGLQTFFLDLKLALRCTGLQGALRAMRREALIRKHHPDSAFAYLWFIGVEPAEQGKGKGSALLSELRALCGPLPVYLETSVRSNLEWYGRQGFKQYHCEDIGCTLYFLRFGQL